MSHPAHKNAKSMEIIIDLNAVIISIDPNNQGELTVLTIDKANNLLPWGQYDPMHHKTMEIGLRHWVKNLSGMMLDYVEQLYTFGDSGRFSYGDPNRHIVSTGYLAIVNPEIREQQPTSQWRNIYDFFPWEDFRNGRPPILDKFILPKLYDWSDGIETDQRIKLSFGSQNDVWDEENTVARFELMYEANLVFEAVRDANPDMSGEININEADTKLPTGSYMPFDHRRILATALGRIRSKVKYKPVIFDLMSNFFTLFELQKSTEAILGHRLHKQNFRRYVEREKLVVKTDEMQHQPSGRPASLYEFNKQLVGVANVVGLKIGNSSSAY